MISKVIKNTAIMLMLAAVFSSCNKKPVEEFVICGCNENTELQGENITFTTAWLNSSSCKWINRNDGKVIIINSYDEFKKHNTCNESNFSFPFSTQSILFANAVICGYPFLSNYPSLQQISPNEYVLSVEIIGLPTEPAAEWSMAVRTSKLSEEADVQLRVCVMPPPLLIDTAILGKWKLIERDRPPAGRGGSYYDYSQYNIVYEFKNYVLTITADTHPGGLRPGGLLGIGEHYYLTDNSFINYGYNRIQFNAYDNSGGYSFSADRKELRIGNGSTYYFVKME